MSKLEFVGSRAPGHSSLHRRSSPGPWFTFIASLALTLAYELEGARAALAELATRLSTHPARPATDEAPSPKCEF